MDHGGAEQKALIRTHPSKVYFDILNPDPNDIRMADICHHLSLTNRFGGGTPQPYSVLSHSLLVSRLCARIFVSMGGHASMARDIERAGLLHDATEAYVQDINGLLKKVDEMAGYRNIEHGLARAIESRFELRPRLLEDAIVKQADKQAFEFECAFIRDSQSYVAPDPAKVRDEFYRRYIELWPFGGHW